MGEKNRLEEGRISSSSSSSKFCHCMMLALLFKNLINDADSIDRLLDTSTALLITEGPFQPQSTHRT